MISDYKSLAPVHEFLHKPIDTEHPGLTETTWLTFHSPEAGLLGEIYVWWHSKLRVTTTSLWIWRGYHRSRLTADFHDHRLFSPYIEGDLTDYTTPVGVRIQVKKPLEEIHVSYNNPQRKVQLEMVQTALVPAVAREHAMDIEKGYLAENQGGLEQAMRVRGNLVMGNEKFSLDGFAIRDRSWNQTRDEEPRDVPPFTWSAAVGEGPFAFGFAAFDDEARNPEWKGQLPAQPNGGMLHGWIHRDGETRRVKRISSLTRRDRGMPMSVEAELEDSTGRVFDVKGEILSALPIPYWTNLDTWAGLVRWTVDGKVVWGHHQDVHWDTYARLFEK